MAVILDSDAVVGFLDRSDALHEAADAAIRKLAAKQPILVSVITYAEVITGVRLGHHDDVRVSGFFTEVISRIVPVSVEIADRAAELRVRSKALKMPDALIVASAETEPEVDLLLSGDRDLANLRGLHCKVRLLSASG
ncbi:MAG TPA: PIN domain-containing protein [Candidatus Dormibacteraeota bacterium]|nr:PIN domain-containing protein [Candidatus Dormibacteraeota bacterium]